MALGEGEGGKGNPDFHSTENVTRGARGAAASNRSNAVFGGGRGPALSPEHWAPPQEP